MLSTVLPPMRAWTPHELLPIMPPRVQRLWVAGSGAKVSSKRSASRRRASRTMPGLDARDAGGGIEGHDGAEVLREVDDDGYVAALSGEACASASGEDGCSEIAAGGDGSDDVVDGLWDDEADRDLAVVGGIGRVEGAGCVVEPYLTLNCLAESCL